MSLLTKNALNQKETAAGWEFGLLAEALARLPTPASYEANATLLNAARKLISKPYYYQLKVTLILSTTHEVESICHTYVSIRNSA
eukprot:scaffold477187_cov32-Prasinocladus_malaysianus.AAC.1